MRNVLVAGVGSLGGKMLCGSVKLTELRRTLSLTFSARAATIGKMSTKMFL